MEFHPCPARGNPYSGAYSSGRLRGIQIGEVEELLALGIPPELFIIIFSSLVGSLSAFPRPPPSRDPQLPPSLPPSTLITSPSLDAYVFAISPEQGHYVVGLRFQEGTPSKIFLQLAGGACLSVLASVYQCVDLAPRVHSARDTSVLFWPSQAWYRLYSKVVYASCFRVVARKYNPLAGW